MAFPMPGVASRDKYFQRLDDMLNKHPKECKEALLDLAHQSKTVYEIAVMVLKRHEGPSDDQASRDAEAIRRIRRFWYAKKPEEDYFDLDREVYPPEARMAIVRLAYLRALHEATGGDSARRIRSHYICTGSDFEVVVCRLNPGDPIVNVLVMTGKIREEMRPKPGSTKLEDNEDLWVFTSRRRIDRALEETNPGKRPIQHAAPSLHSIAQGEADIAFPSDGAGVGMLRPRTTHQVVVNESPGAASAYGQPG